VGGVHVMIGLYLSRFERCLMHYKTISFVIILYLIQKFIYKNDIQKYQKHDGFVFIGIGIIVSPYQ
jgi:hypothetical protein